MLCTLCQHGVTRAVDGVPTGATWDCLCGESHCRHIANCKCGRIKGMKFYEGEERYLLKAQVDDDGEDGSERHTPAGYIVRIAGVDKINPYSVYSPATGGSWFFSEAELEAQTESVSEHVKRAGPGPHTLGEQIADVFEKLPKPVRRVFTSSGKDLGEPGYRERSGQTVTVTRPLTDEEADLYEVGPMFRIRFDDGTEANAFDDELSKV